MSSMLLLPEDQNLLIDIHNHIYVDMDYITEKVYPNHKKKSVYYRLNRLVQENYLKNELLPIPVPRSQVRKSGRPQNVYTLANKGVEIVRGLRGEVHWKSSWSQRSATFVYHSLMLARIESAMTLASEQEERLELKEWINEPRATFQYAKGKNRVIRPDGIAVIGLKEAMDKNIGVFMEMERSYGSKEVLEKKILRYNDFMQREEKQKEYRIHAGMAYEVPIWRLVFVAGSESREKELIRYLKEVNSSEIPVYITLFQDILQDPFGNIYRNIRNSDKKVRL
ncbi:replication-relaxation family protein [Bacillus arachidis]|uniref:replication-relaxation family protein n=1 Tax=Bacillus arachidis TaxID=2819290 RepID=UPI00255CC1DB|nr:replication-relaxation family protein [Bacillus arachidis]WIY59034.1 replication-relaxation family protein [Bacillus arachidis]